VKFSNNLQINDGQSENIQQFLCKKIEAKSLIGNIFMQNIVVNTDGLLHCWIKR